MEQKPTMRDLITEEQLKHWTYCEEEECIRCHMYFEIWITEVILKFGEIEK